MSVVDIVVCFAILHFTWLGYQLVQHTIAEDEQEVEL